MWDWVLLAVGLVTAIYWYMTWHHNHWRQCGVYSLPGALPGVGHMWDAFILKKGFSWLHCEMYHEGKGHPAVGVYSFRSPSLVVRDPHLIQTVLISDFSSFHDNTVVMDETIDPYISKNPFVLRGQRWKSLRQQLAPAFTAVRIKAMFPLMEKVCHEFYKYMEKHQNEDINVNNVAGLFTSEIVAKCAFGLDGNAFSDPNAIFYQQGRKLWDTTLYNPFYMIVMWYFPSLIKLLRKSIIPPEVAEFFVGLVKQADDFRAKNPDKAPDNDYLQFLFNLRNKDPEFTIDDIVSHCLTFFTDGFETSSVTASFVLYELTVNPEIQESVRKEVKSMDAFSYENITSLPLLDRVFQETMRKYTVFSLTKECTKDTVLEAEGQSYPVLKGQHVILPVYAIQNDPEIYPDPDRFDPDRFLPENVKSRHPQTFLGFGAGPRICIGNRFAACQVKVLIANVLTNFRLLKCGKTVDKIQLSPTAIFPVCEQGIWVQFQKL